MNSEQGVRSNFMNEEQLKEMAEDLIDQIEYQQRHIKVSSDNPNCLREQMVGATLDRFRLINAKRS